MAENLSTHTDNQKVSGSLKVSETLTPSGVKKHLDLRVFFYKVLLNLTNQIYNQIPYNPDG